MSTQIQRRRGTTAQHASFTGAVGETTIDTDKEVVVVHDGVQVGGYPQMRENGSNSALALGSAGTPSLKFTGDTNTGIYSPGSDQVAISTGGSGRLFINSAGNVGIGAANTGAAFLEVGGSLRWQTQGIFRNSTNTSTLLRFAEIGSRDVRLDTWDGTDFNGTIRHGAQTYLVETGTGASLTERLRITSAGLVGVGTSTPGTALDVNGAIRSNDIFTLYKNSTDAFYIGAGTIITGGTSTDIALRSNQNGSILFSTNGATERMRIDASGRVGIGTTPAALFDANGLGRFLSASPSYPASGKGLEIYYDSSGDLGYIQTYDRGASAWKSLNLGGASVRFNISGNEAARIDSSSRLLVGTSTARANFFNGAFSPGFQLEGTTVTNSSNRFASLVFGDGSSPGPIIALGKHRSSSIGGTTVVASGDEMGQISFQGSDGTEFVEGANIRAEVDGTPGANDMPGRLVFSTTADGASSPTERGRINSSGATKFTTSASYRGSGTAYHEFTQGNQSDICLVTYSSNASYNSEVQRIQTARSASSLFSFLLCDNNVNVSGDTEFNLRGDGNGYCDGSWTGGGADYAEYFEWSDSNPNEEDRRGISVVLDGDKIREAVAGEDPIGVISGNPSVVGDAAWNKWSGKYLRDEFGTYIQEDYEVVNDEGETVVQQRRKLNPAYDPDIEYIPREQRPEWDCVGLMGKLRIRKGQVTGSRWIKMRDISDTVEEWLVR